ncbi:MAG: hypothetical protein IPN76_23585 [Saprospiraceae bacterium]|nr:hypothetical protein [Saprospiraceae bacterium]
MPTKTGTGIPKIAITKKQLVVADTPAENEISFVNTSYSCDATLTFKDKNSNSQRLLVKKRSVGICSVEPDSFIDVSVNHAWGVKTGSIFYTPGDDELMIEIVGSRDITEERLDLNWRILGENQESREFLTSNNKRPAVRTYEEVLLERKREEDIERKREEEKAEQMKANRPRWFEILYGPRELEAKAKEEAKKTKTGNGIPKIAITKKQLVVADTPAENEISFVNTSYSYDATLTFEDKNSNSQRLLVKKRSVGICSVEPDSFINVSVNHAWGVKTGSIFYTPGDDELMIEIVGSRDITEERLDLNWRILGENQESREF